MAKIRISEFSAKNNFCPVVKLKDYDLSQCWPAWVDAVVSTYFVCRMSDFFSET